MFVDVLVHEAQEDAGLGIGFAGSEADDGVAAGLAEEQALEDGLGLKWADSGDDDEFVEDLPFLADFELGPDAVEFLLEVPPDPEEVVVIFRQMIEIGDLLLQPVLLVVQVFQMVDPLLLHVSFHPRDRTALLLPCQIPHWLVVLCLNRQHHLVDAMFQRPDARVYQIVGVVRVVVWVELELHESALHQLVGDLAGLEVGDQRRVGVHRGRKE